MRKINNFLKLKQWNTDLFVFSLKAKDLLQFSSIENSRDKENIKNKKWFQRKLDFKRVEKIRKYLLNNNSDIPTNFIVNICTEENINEGFSGKSVFKGNEIILSEKWDLLIIDWQHRLAALNYIDYNEKNAEWVKFKELKPEEKDKLDNFEILITGYKDLWKIDMARIFITINNNQKKVSKSVIFDLLNIKDSDLWDIDKNTEKILLSWLSIEQIKATEIIEELNTNIKGYWNGVINYEWWKTKNIELWSFVEHLSFALKENRFLWENKYADFNERVKIINLFYNNFINTVYSDKYNDDWEYITRYEQFIDKTCILSKPSWVWIVFSKDFFDKILKLSLDKNGEINENTLQDIFKNFVSFDFSTKNESYKWKLASRSWYKEVIDILTSKIK